MSLVGLRLRQVAPDGSDNFVVLNEHGDRSGHIGMDKHVPAGVPELVTRRLPVPASPRLTGRCETIEDAKTAVEERWPDYLAELEYDGVLQRVRREKLGVPTRMFVCEDELQAAPAQRSLGAWRKLSRRLGSRSWQKR